MKGDINNDGSIDRFDRAVFLIKLLLPYTLILTAIIAPVDNEFRFALLGSGAGLAGNTTSRKDKYEESYSTPRTKGDQFF